MPIFSYPVSKDLWDTREFGNNGLQFKGKGEYGAFGNAVYSPTEAVVDRVLDLEGQSSVILLHVGEPLFSIFDPLISRDIKQFIAVGDKIAASHQIGKVDGKVLSWRMGKIGERDAWIDIGAWMAGEGIKPLGQRGVPDKKTDWTWPALGLGLLYVLSQD